MSEVEKSSSKKEKSNVPMAKGWIGGGRYVESVLVNGDPAFLVVNASTGKIAIEPRFELDKAIIRPLYKNECGYALPSFESEEEIQRLAESPISTEEVLDWVYERAKMYVAASQGNQFLIAVEIVLTYCQDRLPTMHFPYFVGETESGKTTVLYLFLALAYHCIVSSSLSYASIYNILGIGGEGSVTICEDEAQDVTSDKEKIRIYKSSYAKGSRVPRVIPIRNGRKIEYYPTYCTKVLAGEGLPHDKGFLERLVVVHMRGGNPQRNLKMATNDEQEEMRKFQNKMLIWKMLNIRRELPKISSGFSGRDQELWDGFLSVVSGTKYESLAREVAEHYVAERQQTIKDSLEATIFRIIRPKLEVNHVVEMWEIWNAITNSDELPGRLDDTGKTFYPDYHDKITLNSLSKMLLYKYQAKRIAKIKHVDGKNKQTTYYEFDPETVKILAQKYRVE